MGKITFRRDIILKELFNKFQAALAGTVLLLALSLLAVVFPVQNELIDSERSNFRTEAQMYLISLNNFVQNCIQGTEGLCRRSMVRDKIIAYMNGEINYTELKSSTQLKYNSGASHLKNCLLAIRLVDNHILNTYGDNDFINSLDLSDKTYSGVSFIKYNGKPLLIVHSPFRDGDRLLGCDLVVYDPSQVMAELNLTDYKASILTRSEFKPRQQEIIDHQLITHNNHTSFYGDILQSNAILLLTIDDSILYKSVRNSTAKNMLIIVLSLTITLLLIYFFVYRPAQQLLAELRSANKEQQVQKAKVEKLSNGQKALFNIFRYLSESWSFADDFTVISRSLPFIINYRNFLIAARESKEAPSFTIKEITGDLTSRNLESMLSRKGTILEQAISTGEPFYSGNVQAEVNAIDRYHSEIQSIIIAPVIYKNFKWGLVAIDHMEKNAFTQLDFELMNMLASHIALHLEEMDAKNKLNQEANRLRALHELVNKSLLERDAGMISHLITDMLAEMDFCSTAIYRTIKGEQGCDFELLVQNHYQEPEPDIEIFSPDLLQQAAAAKTMKIVEPEAGRCHQFLTPIGFRNELYGIFCLARNQPFTNQDVEFALIIGNYLAVFWELNSLITRIEREALIDPLTGVWNRRYLMKRIEEEDEKIKRYGGEASVAILDLGNFKLINDRFGHAAGDEVLKATANAILKTIRSVDSVGRYGGDEFIVLFPNTSLQQAKKALYRVNQEISRQRPAGVDIDIFADFGAAACPLDSPRLLEAINIADARMYDNKRDRKGQDF
ncbi:sensor domain-containing diguanylate cyclase [Syntrophomonas curvata]